jgi:protein CLEC16A
MLALFLDIMHNAKEKSSVVFVPVLIQILQTMSILCQCVKNDTSLYYILSNNYINEFLKYPYDFENDELLDHFVSFLKSLSLRMNDQTIQFFFIEKTKTIPLLNRAIELLRFRDGMVRIAAQSSILNIFKVNVDQARSICLQDETLHSLFSQIGKLKTY